MWNLFVKIAELHTKFFFHRVNLRYHRTNMNFAMIGAYRCG